MDTLHVANISFEKELERLSSFDLCRETTSNPLFLQLQFLPFIYGKQEDSVFTWGEAPQDYIDSLRNWGLAPPQETSLPLKPRELEVWEASSSTHLFAKTHRLLFQAPSAEVVRKVHSKFFSFSETDPLPHAILISSWEELAQWVYTCKGPKVLKSCFGESGNGHFHIHSLDDPHLLSFVEKQWKCDLPILAEPWVERKVDFSTQWFIDTGGSISYLGATLCQNNAQGHYRGTLVNPQTFSANVPKALFERHMEKSSSALEKMYALGFFGYVGIDAMIHSEGILHPIVEINARKTIGLVALLLYEKLRTPLKVFIEKAGKSPRALLPSYVSLPSQKNIHFPYQLYLDL